MKRTYFESCKTKITDLDIEAVIYKNIVTLYISVHNAQRMHIVEGPSNIPCNAEFYFWL